MIDLSSLEAASAALLVQLRRSLGLPDLAFAEPPARLLGGNRSFVYGFRLRGAPSPYSGPLVLRILRTPRAGEVRREASLHDALLDADYPVPCILVWGEDAEPLGGPFQIQERVPGVPLLHGYDDPAHTGKGFLRQQLVGLRQALFSPWPERLAALHTRLHGIEVERIAARLEVSGFPRRALGLEARLERMATHLSGWGVDGLSPSLEWLADRAPVHRGPFALCHGDLFPNQVRVSGAEVAGILDWSDALFGPPELDVGIVKAGLETLPLLPGPLAGAGRAILRRLAGRFARAYQRERPLDPEALRFSEVFRCVLTLASLVERRLSLAGLLAEPPAPNPYDSPAGETALRRHLARLASLEVGALHGRLAPRPRSQIGSFPGAGLRHSLDGRAPSEDS
ncbi:MAG: phosphotransferase [Myxococcota bacterium]